MLSGQNQAQIKLSKIKHGLAVLSNLKPKLTYHSKHFKNQFLFSNMGPKEDRWVEMLELN